MQGRGREPRLAGTLCEQEEVREPIVHWSPQEEPALPTP